MKIHFLFLLTCLTLLANDFVPVHAATMSCSEKQGKLYCGAIEVDHLRYLGDAVLNGTSVKGAMNIIGDLEMHHSHVNEISVNGDLQASDSDVAGEAIVRGNATLSNIVFKTSTRIVGDVKASNATFAAASSIIGDLDVNNSQFNGLLTLAADKAYFVNSKSLAIDFTKTDKAQNLYLSQNSFVNGDINFPANRGTVYINSGSRVGGKVNGGKIINN